MNHPDIHLIQQNFPQFSQSELVEALQTSGKILTFESGDYIMDKGQPVEFIPLLLSGSMRVIRRDEDDKELLLYYLSKGDTCASSLTCCMDRSSSEVEAIAEEKTMVLAVPSHLLDEWMDIYPEWKAFVMHTYRNRFQELLETIDAIAFHQLDERMMRYLKDRVNHQNGDPVVQASHQEIANDLHSSREVISRLLKEMERKGLVQLNRSKVKLLQKVS